MAQKALERLFSLPVIAQRTQPWLDARNKVLTASEFASCFKLTEDVIRPYVEFSKRDDFPARPRKSAGKDSAAALIKKKAGLGIPFKGNRYTEFGTLYEPVAACIYQQMTGKRLYEFGLIPHPTVPFLGASPDGCREDGILLEIKCPSSRVPDGRIPFEYWCQMQLQLECCDLAYCDFLDARFVEYVDEEAWRSAAALQEASGASHHTHGFILIDDIGDPHHAGPEIRTLSQFEEWERSITKLRPCTRLLYALWSYVLIRVPREREWMADRIPEIERVWNAVVDLRLHLANGDADRTPPSPQIADDEVAPEVDWRERKRARMQIRCNQRLV